MDDHRFKIIVAGRRWGKTMLGLIAVLTGHGTSRQYKGALQGGQIWWIAPTYGIANNIWGELKFACKDGWEEKREDERKITFSGGGSITVKSADNPDSLRGTGLDGICFDEAAYMSEETWTMALRPALADRRGWAIFISTPKMDDKEKKGIEWFKTLFINAKDDSRWGYWQRPTHDNEMIAREELEELLKMPDLAYRQEILAEFVDVGEGLFQKGWFRYYYRDGDTYYLISAEGLVGVKAQEIKIILTADLAAKQKETSDYTVVEAWGITPGRQLLLLDVLKGKYSENQTKHLFWDAWRKWNPKYIGIESNGFQYTYVQSLREGTILRDEKTGAVFEVPPLRVVELLTKREDKFTRAITIADHYKVGRVYHPDVSRMNAPWLKSFEHEMLAFPSKQVHDDQVDAASYAGIELLKPGVLDARDMPFMVFSGKRRW